MELNSNALPAMCENIGEIFLQNLYRYQSDTNLNRMNKFLVLKEEQLKPMLLWN